MIAALSSHSCGTPRLSAGIGESFSVYMRKATLRRKNLLLCSKHKLSHPGFKLSDLIDQLNRTALSLGAYNSAITSANGKGRAVASIWRPMPQISRSSIGMNCFIFCASGGTTTRPSGGFSNPTAGSAMPRSATKERRESYEP